MEFQKHLLNIAKSLGRDQVKALAFLCTELMVRSSLSVEQASDLFSYLMDHGHLSPERPQLLNELLLTIHRPLLVCDLNDPTPTSTTSNLISPYRKLLYNLSEEITDDDVKQVKFLLQNYLPRRKLDDRVTLLEVFLELEHKDLLSKTNLSLLENIIQSVCPMLKERIVRFKQTQAIGHSAQEMGPSKSMTYPLEPNQVPPSLESTVPSETPEFLGVALQSSLSLCTSVEVSRVDMGRNDQNDLTHRPGGLSTQATSCPSLHESDALKLLQETSGPEEVVTTNTDDEDLRTYPMTAGKRGICLIVNNYDFTKAKPPHRNREGTKFDEESLSSVFEWLGFEVDIHRDCTKETMVSIIQELSSRDHGEVDCLVCCILSHGKEECVYGVDGNTVELMELMEPFSGSKCLSLANKPKLFFIQACQGTNEQKPVCIEFDGPAGSLSCGRKAKASIPSDAHFLLGIATVPSYVSFRDPSRGTWFIQSLCQNLIKMVPRGCDLMSILTKVNADVSKKTDSTGQKKQMPQPAFSLTQKVVFPIPEAPPPPV